MRARALIPWTSPTSTRHSSVDYRSFKRAQKAFFNAATANAFTTVFAGFALTTTSLPKISRLPAGVAGFLRVFTMQTPGMVNLTALFSSFVAIPPRLAITLLHSDFFKPDSFAKASARAVFVMGAAPFIAPFIALGAILPKVGLRRVDNNL